MNHEQTSSTGDNVGCRAIIVMGPSGCGKTSVGSQLALSCNATFIDADAHHPLTNIDKMRQGIALNDEDRLPWLHRLAELISRAGALERMVLACSALKAHYRGILAQGDASIQFVCLMVPRAELERRLNTRPGHFFNPDLLQSQLEALEVPVGSEVDGSQPLDQIVAQIAQRVGWELTLFNVPSSD